MISHIADADADLSRVEFVITEPVIAAVAVAAAAAVAGVTRLEPGLGALVTSVTRAARRRLANVDPAPTEGVRVTVDGLGATPIVTIEVDLVVSAQDQVAAVVRTVQRAVARSVLEATGLATSSVSVSVMDIETPGSPQ